MSKTIAFTLIALSTLALNVSGAPIITEVTSRAAFDALFPVNSQTTDDFQSTPVGQTPSPFATSVGTFTNNNVYYVANSPGGLGIGDGSIFVASNTTAYANTLTLNPGVSGAGSDVFSSYGAVGSFYGITALVTATNGASTVSSSFNFNLPGATGAPSTAFEGFAAAPGYTLVSVTYETNTEYLALDNYSVASTPEPHTYALMGVGLAVLAGALRLRRLRAL